jgi:hypothetical protein
VGCFLPRYPEDWAVEPETLEVVVTNTEHTLTYWFRLHLEQPRYAHQVQERCPNLPEGARVSVRSLLSRHKNRRNLREG